MGQRRDLDGLYVPRELVMPFVEQLEGVLAAPFSGKVMTAEVASSSQAALDRASVRQTFPGDAVAAAAFVELAASLVVHDVMLDRTTTEAQRAIWRASARTTLLKCRRTGGQTSDEDDAEGQHAAIHHAWGSINLLREIGSAPNCSLAAPVVTAQMAEQLRGLLGIDPQTRPINSELADLLVRLFALLLAHDRVLVGGATEQEIADWSNWAHEVLQKAEAMSSLRPAGNPGEEEVPPLTQLESLIGIPQAKYQVRTILSRQRLSRMREERGLPGLDLLTHMAFVGPPGTGKTTVARLLAQVMAGEGVLSRGHLVEAARDRLVGGYLGQTALKTRTVLDEAKGGMLFIDEAYALATDDYGAEAVGTLLKGMEEEDLVVVFAGYADDMDRLWAANPGLRSRVGDVIDFEPMTPADLKAIFDLRVRGLHLTLTEDADRRVTAHLEEVGGPRREPHFGNAREVVNLVDDLLGCQATRITALPTKEPDLHEVTLSDVECAVARNV